MFVRIRVVVNRSYHQPPSLLCDISTTRLQLADPHVPGATYRENPTIIYRKLIDRFVLPSEVPIAAILNQQSTWSCMLDNRKEHNFSYLHIIYFFEFILVTVYFCLM